jgi:HSP20 family protein
MANTNFLENLYSEVYTLLESMNTEKVKTAIRPIFYELEKGDENYTLEVALPGYTKDDIDIKVDNKLLSISFSAAKETDKWKQNFDKKFKVNDELDLSNIKASFANGILTVLIPKVEKAKPKTITIE